MNILQTPTFKRQIKKLHKNQIRDLNLAINKIIVQPNIGNIKKGDLNGILIFKFKMIKQLALLAYKINNDQSIIFLLALGSHENFYRNLKN